MQRLTRIALQTIGLSSPKGRLLFFALVTSGVFFAPYSWLGHLSLWQLLQIPSPSIGLTRAYWKFLHLDFAGAWHRNALIYAVLVVVIAIVAKDIYTLLHARRTSPKKAASA